MHDNYFRKDETIGVMPCCGARLVNPIRHHSWCEEFQPKDQKDISQILCALAMKQKQDRTAMMPTEEDALFAMTQAYHRLTELGWKPAIYCPKDGTEFKCIEAGSAGIFTGTYCGDWPDGDIWTNDGGEADTINPILIKVESK